MQNRISYYILSLLHLHGSVKIPGLGRVRQVRASAHPDPVSGKIAPPQTKSTLEPSDSDVKAGLLERYLSYKTQMSRTRARKEILRFSHAVREELKQGKKADIGMLGQISLVDDTMHFEPNETLLNPGFANWPEVTLPGRLPDAEPLSYPALPDEPMHAAESLTQEPEPVEESLPLLVATPNASDTSDTIYQPNAHEAHEEPEHVAPEPDQAASPALPDEPARAKRNQQYLLIPLVAILFLAFIAAGYFLFRPDTDTPGISDTAPPVETQYNQKPHPPEPSSSDVVPVIPEDPGEVEAEIADAEELSSLTPSDPGSRDQTQVPGGQHEEYAAETPLPEQVADDTLTGCLVVTGAFARTVNAHRMVKRLQSLGYEVRMIQHGTLAQVGVPVDCASPQLVEVVNTLRASVDSAAWVLRPE